MRVRDETTDQPPHSDWERGIELANEFTAVQLKLVDTANGIRLEIFSPKLGHRVRLDPLALESLTWQPPETFSAFMQTPLGPIEPLD